MREVLLRPLYRGEIVWNQTRKRDSWGLSRRADRASEAWVRIPAPQLQIVSDDLWAEAQARFAERQHRFTTGRRSRDIESRYLLSGFARCGQCGGGLAAHSRNHGGRRVFFYGCTSFWKRGSSVCRNNMVARMDVLDAEVLATLEDDEFRPAVIEEAVRLALAELSPVRQETNRQELTRELEGVRQECDRLAEAIGRGGPLDALLDRLADRQARRVVLEGELRTRVSERVHSSPRALETAIRSKLSDWRRLLRRNVAEGRAVLRALLVGPLRFTPIDEPRRRAYAFSGTIALDRLLAGVLELPTKVASPTGNPISPIPLLTRVRRPPRWSRA